MRSIIMPMLKMEIPLAVTETIEALWADNRRPQIHVKKKTVNGYTFTIALPAGISFKDFYSKHDYFKDAAGGNKVQVDISQSGKMVILEIDTDMLGDYFTYSADYTLKGIMPIPVGYSNKGLEVIDLASLPHMLIGGCTGSGKSGCIHVAVNSLLNLPVPPTVVLIDLKMSEYNYLEKRVMLVTELETACQALDRLVQEMRKRQLLLKQSGFNNIAKYNAKCSLKLQYIVLVIDELAELKNKDAQEDLETLLRLCRTSGICIVAATQRPSSKIFSSKSFGDAKANFNCRICYQVLSGTDSRIILDSGEGANLPCIPGRAIMRNGRDLIEIQTPYLDPEEVQNNDEFQEARQTKRQQINRDTNGVGRIGCKANSNTPVPIR